YPARQLPTDARCTRLAPSVWASLRHRASENLAVERSPLRFPVVFRGPSKSSQNAAVTDPQVSGSPGEGVMVVVGPGAVVVDVVVVGAGARSGPPSVQPTTSATRPTELPSAVYAQRHTVPSASDR